MLSACSNNVSFGYRVIVDSGASDSKRGTFKVSIKSDITGDELIKTDIPKDLEKVGPASGFTSPKDYIDGLSRCITGSIEFARNNISKLSGDDKKLSGVVIYAPGYVKGDNIAPLLPNLKDNEEKPLSDVNFNKVDLQVDKTDNYKLIATNDMHGCAAGVAKKLKEIGKLEDGMSVKVCMTGGGMGVVSIKRKGDRVEIEGSEAGHSSNYDPKGANSLEKSAASVSGLINNYAKELSLTIDDTNSLLDKGDSRVVTRALNSSNQKLAEAANTAIDKYIDTISQEFARNVLTGDNLIILTGPLAQGIKEALAQYTHNPDELKERVMASIDRQIIKSGPAELMMKIHDFKVDTDFDVPNNTIGGSILMDHAKSIGKNVRGNWLAIPYDKL